MALVLLVAASVAYAVGGLFMKQSDGLTHVGPTVAFLLLFGTGASLQALGMKDSDMGVSYVFVLGVEAVAAVGLGALVLQERLSASRIAAVVLVLVGMAWLRRT